MRSPSASWWRATPSARTRQTSTTTRRASWPQPGSPPSSSRACSPPPGWPAGLRTSWSTWPRTAASSGQPRSGPAPTRASAPSSSPDAGDPGPHAVPTLRFVPDDQFEVAVLGSGTGGYTAALRPAPLRKRTALIEVPKLGGACLHVGCIPTKALLESSGLYHKLHDRSQEFGIVVPEIAFDFERIATRRDGVVNQLWKGVQGLMRKNRIEVVQGCGVMEGEERIRVDDRMIQAQAIIVATGSSPKSLPGVEFDGERVVNSDHATLARKLPESVAIIGAGAVGVEFATFYRQMGASVTLIEALDRLVPLEDEEVSRVLLQAFQRAGIDVRLKAKVKGVRRGHGEVTVELEDGNVSADQLLVTGGRGRNGRDMDL